MPGSVSGASGALATLVLLLLVFLLVLMARTTIGDAIVSAAGEFANFRVWGTTNPLNNSEDEISSPVYDARVVSADLPAEMTPGQAYPANITMKNVGTIPWYAEGSIVKLCAVGGSNGHAYRFTAVGSFPMAEGVVVRPGGDYSFLFDIIAPGAGQYLPEFQMTGDEAGNFGEKASKNIKVEAAATPTPTPTPTIAPTPEPTYPPYEAYVAYGKYIMIGRSGKQETGYIFQWCYDGPLTHHNQRSSYLNEPWWPYPDWDIGGPNGYYSIYSDYYLSSGAFDMNYGGYRGTITFYRID